MLRKGSAGVLRQALQYGLQQPVQQTCVQLQVLNLQAVRFRSKPSIPKRVYRSTRAEKAAEIQKKALERAVAIKGLGPQAEQPVSVSSTVPSSAAAAAAARAATSDGSSLQGIADTPASATEQPAAASTSSSTGDSSSSSSVWPSWMRNILGDRGKRRGRAPVQASPLTPTTALKGASDKADLDNKQADAMAANQEAAAGSADGQQEGGQPAKARPADGWEATMGNFNHWTLNEYAQQIRNDPNSEDFEASPRPMTPLRGARAFYDSMFDARRAAYVRYEMQYNLITAMSSEVKLAIKDNPDFHKDEAAMRRLAQSIQLTGTEAHTSHRRQSAHRRRTKDTDMLSTKMDMIRDLVHVFHKQKREYKMLHDYRAAGGQMPPVTDSYQVEKLRKKLAMEHEKETHKKLMALRDVRKCELKKLEANLGRAPLKHICPQTALPYQECCGRKNRLLAKSNLRDKRLLATAA